MTTINPKFDACSVCSEHQLLQSIFDTTDAAIFRLDNFGRITLVNQRMLEIFKQDRDNLIGHLYNEALLDNSSDTELDSLTYLIENGQTDVNVCRLYTRADGTEFWGHLKMRKLSTPKAEADGFVCVISDITEQKLVEQDLLQCRTRFSVMTDTLPCGLYDFLLHSDGRGEFTYLSSRGEEIFEVSFAEIKNDIWTFYNTIHPDDLVDLLDKNKPCFIYGELFSTELRVTTRTGKQKWIKLSALPNKILLNKATVWSGYILDITKQKNLEQNYLELNIAHRIALEHERIMEDLHDGFGSQLSSAGLQAQRGELSNAQMAKLLQECMEDLQLVVDTFSNQEKNLHMSLVNFRYRLQQRNNNSLIKFNWNIKLDHIPSMDSRTILHVLRIAQEVINNALKHANAKQISISATYIDQTLIVSIKDDGVGMPDLVKTGRGLQNINKRAHDIGGYLHYEQQTPGTEVCLVLALKH